DNNYYEKSIKIEIYRAHVQAGMKRYDLAFEILNEQKKTFAQKEEEIFGSNTKLWLNYALLYAYAEITHMKRPSKSEAELMKLVELVAENENNILYRQMYAGTKMLLEKTGNTNMLEQLTKP
ncbi:MAG: hypothetical protein WBA74_25715, partial [Cyclobacteriaceae bacterium]